MAALKKSDAKRAMSKLDRRAAKGSLRAGRDDAALRREPMRRTF